LTGRNRIDPRKAEVDSIAPVNGFDAPLGACLRGLMRGSMTRQSTTVTILNMARKRVLAYALRRPETPLLLLVSLVLTTASVLGYLPRPLWLLWLALGAAGIVMMSVTAVRGDEYLTRFVSDVFYRRFNIENLQLPDLRRGVSEVLQFHRAICKTIMLRPQAPLGDIAIELDDWVARIYDVASSIDTFVNSDRVQTQLRVLTGTAAAVNPATHLVEATRALIELNPDAIPLSDDERAQLWRIKQTVSLAKRTLDASLVAMVTLHDELAKANPIDLNRDYASEKRQTIIRHCVDLTDADRLLRELFQDYIVVETLEAEAEVSIEA
jgi:hypothetical protein